MATKRLGLGLGLGLGIGIGTGIGIGFPLGDEGAAQREQLEADDAERPHVGRAAVGLAGRIRVRVRVRVPVRVRAPVRVMAS